MTRNRAASANLTPASGRQDHTTSPSALAPLVLRSQSVHRIPHPTFVTMANAPLIEAGRRKLVEVICPTGQAKYFSKRDWTTQISLNRFSKFEFTRMRFRKPFWA